MQKKINRKNRGTVRSLKVKTGLKAGIVYDIGEPMDEDVLGRRAR
jgi:hypothetical protein